MAFTVKESRKNGAAGTPVVVFTPETAGTYAVVFVMPERYGLVPHTLDMARRIATNGFVVAVPDLMYAHPDQEQLHAGNVDCEPSDDEIFRMLDDAMPVVSAVSPRLA